MVARRQARADEFARLVTGRVSATFAQKGIVIELPKRPLTVRELGALADRALEVNIDPCTWVPQLVR